MTQSDIYELLKDKLLSGDLRYFSCEDIRLLLKDKDIFINRNSINNSVLKLRVFGFLDSKIIARKNKGRATYPIVVYRLKRDSIK